MNTSKSAPRPSRSHSSVSGLIVFLIFIAAVLRILAATNELWFDEIWSITFARSLHSPWGVFTEIHHDNNHYLNTLYLYVIGTPGTWALYRLPAIAAGTLSALLAAMAMGRQSKAAAVGAAALIGVSYPLVQYGSEARGYAVAVFAAILGVYLMDRFITTGRRVWAVLFGLSALIGFLGHLTYAQAYLGLAVWSVYRVLRLRGLRAWASWSADLACCHVLPVAGLTALYVFDLSHLAVGGAPPSSTVRAITSLLSLCLGGPADNMLVAMIAIGLAVAAVVALWRAGNDLWLLFAVSVFVAPTLIIVASPLDFSSERYFLVSAAMLLLSLAWLGASIWQRSRFAAAVLLMIVLAGSAAHDYRLITVGHGSYLPALRFMTEHSRRPQVVVGGDHDFRHPMMVAFYERFLPQEPRINFVLADQWPARGPEWFLIHDFAQGTVHPARIADSSGNQYVLVAVYPHGSLSGWSLFLYQNVN